MLPEHTNRAGTMSSNPATASRIYNLLKADITAGRFAPGKLLVERSLAAEYGTSVTPVRNAASQLVGERLLAPHPGGGYELPMLDSEQLRDLYFWHSQLVRIALNPKRMIDPSDRHCAFEAVYDLSTPTGTALAAADLFGLIARLSPSQELQAAVLSAGDRLGAVRRVEPTLLNGTAEEIVAVQGLTAAGRWSDLVSAIWAYHRRRLRRAGELAVALQMKEGEGIGG